MRFLEILREAIVPLSDKELWEKGRQDGLRGKADFEFLGVGRNNESQYWAGFDYGKAQSSPRREPRLPVSRLRRIVPPTLKSVISKADLTEIFRMMVAGHSLDGVQAVPPRDVEEALEAIETGLREIAASYSGTLQLYRTIEVENPDQWIRDNLRRSRPLGRYWSRSEDHVMAHDKSECVLFCVDAPGTSVDWPETIILQVDGVESEVRLRPGRPIKLLYTEPVSTSFEPNQFV